jgi:hypothetical protein
MDACAPNEPRKLMNPETARAARSAMVEDTPDRTIGRWKDYDRRVIVVASDAVLIFVFEAIPPEERPSKTWTNEAAKKNPTCN